MPNWCSNGVTISHTDTAKMEALAAAVKEGKFCNHVVPVPQELTDTIAGSYGDDEKQRALEEQTKRNLEKYGVGNWYDFCVNRWGTKWDVDPYDPAEVKVEDNTITFGFDSAWAPPVGIYEALVEDGFEVVAYYYEPGMAFVGKWDNGVDECYEFGGETSKTVRDAIGDELDDYFDISTSMAEYEDEEEEPDELQEFLEEGAEVKGLTPPDPIKF